VPSSAADANERAIYSLICSADGVKARDIARRTGLDHTTVNRYLYASPFVRELCYRDDAYLWYGLIQQTVPHHGLGDFCGWYGTVGEFLAQDRDAWLEQLKRGCARIGRNLNNARGLFHSFLDTHDTMAALFADLRQLGCPAPDNWELCFELRIRRARYVRIYADVLLLVPPEPTAARPGYAFSLEFKMKDSIEQSEVDQAAKYVPYLEVVLGPTFNVVGALVLTSARDLYTHARISRSTAEVPVASGDMLFNVLDEYLGFLS
jgi:uncharacterized protein CbrC (UPF0167 family)